MALAGIRWQAYTPFHKHSSHYEFSLQFQTLLGSISFTKLYISGVLFSTPASPISVIAKSLSTRTATESKIVIKSASRIKKDYTEK